MGEQFMRNILQEYGNRGNVIIFKNGTPAQLGSWDFEVNRHDNHGIRYNIYVGARGTWVNHGDGGWNNWAIGGNFDREDKVIRFK